MSQNENPFVVLSKENPQFRSICEKVAKNGNKEEIKLFLSSGGSEIPPIKLTPQEMEFIKGGGLIQFFQRASAAIAGAAQTVAGGFKDFVGYGDSSKNYNTADGHFENAFGSEVNSEYGSVW